ncbi:MAG: class I SAM-dependent methyltransferase [Cyclobacteriaceae bacterium]|nr:class I SAM-dependent methyltransferase [Cyclobacteriaceae bacterium]
MIPRIASEVVQQYIFDHEHEDERKLALSKKEILGIPPAVLAEQIRGRKKTKEKLPSYYHTRGIVYPPGINLEQCSSEQTAAFKVTIIQKRLGTKLPLCADLTGGFGIDSLFFSKICNTVHAVDPNESLLEIAKHNHTLLGATNIFYHSITAENFLLQSEGRFDFIYIDPSRRGSANQRVFKFSECEPNVVDLFGQLMNKSDVVLVKASPLVDITQGLLELPHAQHVYIVSVNNECKEVLFLCSSKADQKPTIHAVNLTHAKVHEFLFTQEEEKKSTPTFSAPLTYLYEPNASILKAGAFKLIATQFKLHKVHVNTHLYTSDELVPDFPGRIFRIEATVKPDVKSIKLHLPEETANVITRNYPLTPDTLRKKIGLKDGGEKYVIGFTAIGKRLVVIANRLA